MRHKYFAALTAVSCIAVTAAALGATPQGSTVKEFRYTLTFSGAGKPDKNGVHFDAKASAKLPGTFDASVAGESNLATFHSLVTVRKKAPGTFWEKGTITFGNGTVMFKTAGPGTIGPSPLPGTQAGYVVWKVTGGTGVFANASGYITSNSTDGPNSTIRDTQAGVIFLK